jgi:hypothetical protein
MAGLFRALAISIFVGLVGYVIFLSFTTVLFAVDLTAAIISVLFFILGNGFKNLDLITAAWLILGAISVLSYFGIAQYQATFGLIALIMILLLSYEFSISSFRLDYASWKAGNALSTKAESIMQGYFRRLGSVIVLTAGISFSIVFLASSASLALELRPFSVIFIVSIALTLILALLWMYERTKRN